LAGGRERVELALGEATGLLVAHDSSVGARRTVVDVVLGAALLDAARQRVAAGRLGIGDAARLAARRELDAREAVALAVALLGTEAAGFAGRAREHAANVVHLVALEAGVAAAVQVATATGRAGGAARRGAQAEHVVALEAGGARVAGAADAAGVAVGARGGVSDAQALGARRAVRAGRAGAAHAAGSADAAHAVELAHLVDARGDAVAEAHAVGVARAAWLAWRAVGEQARAGRVALEAGVAEAVAGRAARAADRALVADWQRRAGGDAAEHNVLRVDSRVDVDRRRKRLGEQVERVVAGVDRVAAVHVDRTGSNAHVVVLLVGRSGDLRLERVGERALVRQLLNGVRRRVQKVHEALELVVVDQAELRDVVVMRRALAVGDLGRRVTAWRAAGERERVEHDLGVGGGVARLGHLAHDQRRLEILVEVEDSALVEERHQRHVLVLGSAARRLAHDVVEWRALDASLGQIEESRLAVLVARDRRERRRPLLADLELDNVVLAGGARREAGKRLPLDGRVALVPHRLDAGEAAWNATHVVRAERSALLTVLELTLPRPCAESERRAWRRRLQLGLELRVDREDTVSVSALIIAVKRCLYNVIIIIIIEAESKRLLNINNIVATTHKRLTINRLV
jgi:hypothetical protein